MAKFFKCIIIFIPLLLIGWTSYAQGIDYGLKAGRNIAFMHGNYHHSHEDVTISLNPDFSWQYSAGGFLRYEFIPAFSIQSELLYTTRGAQFSDDVVIRGQDMRIDSDLIIRYVEVPLIFRFSTREALPEPPRYVSASYSYNAYTGISVAYNTSATFSGDLSGDVFGVDFDEPFSNDVRNQFTETDIHFVLGTGFEYGRHTRFLFDLRGSISLLDISDNAESNGNMRNSMVSAAIGVIF